MAPKKPRVNKEKGDENDNDDEPFSIVDDREEDEAVLFLLEHQTTEKKPSRAATGEVNDYDISHYLVSKSPTPQKPIEERTKPSDLETLAAVRPKLPSDCISDYVAAIPNEDERFIDYLADHLGMTDITYMNICVNERISRKNVESGERRPMKRLGIKDSLKTYDRILQACKTYYKLFLQREKRAERKKKG